MTDHDRTTVHSGPLQDATRRPPDLRPVESWFTAYAADHRHPLNQLLHVWCVPAIVWSILAMLYAVPTPAVWIDPMPEQGFFAVAAMALAIAFWLWLSRALGFGILLLALPGIGLAAVLQAQFGNVGLLAISAAVFLIAWVGQFVGHHLEGRRPSFFTDLVYLMIGPPWVLAKAYRRLGLPW